MVVLQQCFLLLWQWHDPLSHDVGSVELEAACSGAVTAVSAFLGFET
jgi:hypothetical protein